MQAVVKTGISLPRGLFNQAEALAQKMNVTRSRLFSLALEDYVQRQRNRQLLAELNEAYADELDEEERTLLQQASHSFQQIVEGEW
jgi:metal-responsive CopG/Arc/MetJ family transcriptional regulator